MASDQPPRSAPRIDILGHVPGEITVLAPITLKNFSVTGVQLETAFPLLLNSIHELRLHLGDATIVVKGRVAHCRVADLGADVAIYRAGIEFIEVPTHVTQAIQAYLDRLQRARQPERPDAP